MTEVWNCDTPPLPFHPSWHNPCVYGQGICYIMVPKCGITSLTHFLLHRNPKQFESVSLSRVIKSRGRSVEYVSVVRDPLDRWTSGVAQYSIYKEKVGNTFSVKFSTKNPDTILPRHQGKFRNFDFNDPHVIDLLLNTTIFDQHTEHQHLFLQAALPVGLQVFRFDDFEGIYDWLESRHITGFRLHTNKSAEHQVRSNVKMLLERFLQTPEYHEKITNVFKVDTRLYAAAKQYRNRTLPPKILA